MRRLVDVVYDGVGRTTFAASIASLRPRGMMVSIGASSGLPDPVSIKTLNEKSLFLTRPSIAAYTRVSTPNNSNEMSVSEPAFKLFDVALTLRRGRGRSREAHHGITRTERTLSFKALRLI